MYKRQGLALGFGALGYAMRYFRLPLLPLVLGVVLGFMVESNYRRALALSSGDHLIFLRDPISAGLLGIALVVVIGSVLRHIGERKRQDLVEPRADVTA